MWVFTSLDVYSTTKVSVSPADPVTLQELVRVVNNVLKVLPPSLMLLKSLVVPTGSYGGIFCSKITFVPVSWDLGLIVFLISSRFLYLGSRLTSQSVELFCHVIYAIIFALFLLFSVFDEAGLSVLSLVIHLCFHIFHLVILARGVQNKYDRYFDLLNDYLVLMGKFRIAPNIPLSYRSLLYVPCSRVQSCHKFLRNHAKI